MSERFGREKNGADLRPPTTLFSVKGMAWTSIRRLLPVVVLLILLSAKSNAATVGGERPNILIILADDLGYSDLGCYGGEISTPNLDSLARDGLKFTQFYNTARCWPSRASLLTGYYAQQIRRDTFPGTALGSRPAWAPLLPALLRPLGYRCYHSGKWHLDGKPLENGFDHSYTLEDHNRHFTPLAHSEDDSALPPVPAGTNYYTTTAIAEHAIRYLREHTALYPRQPFFEFLAFTAPHFPLQAPREDIDRYEDRYRRGWDALRNERWQRMRSLGLGGNSLSAVERDLGPPYPFPEAITKLGANEVNAAVPWIDLTQSQREFQAGKMAIHAAMVDRMDREVGRVLEQLRLMGAIGNTLILFLSDNGASAEMMVRGDGHNPNAPLGSAATFLSLGPGWSSMANAPFRRHKTWVHEGGISTPLIVHWPRGIQVRGELRTTAGHVIDIVPTLLEVAGGKMTDARAGPRRPGRSLAPVFNRNGTVRHKLLWWLHEGNRALRQGNWKIVAAGKDSRWELYNLAEDRSETRNLAASKPGRLQAMAALWAEQTKTFAKQAQVE